MASSFATASPFTTHVLTGFEPVHPHIRYPVTMGLHRAGANHLLFLAPMNIGLLQSFLPIDASDQALVIAREHCSNDHVRHRAEVVDQRPWSTIGQLRESVDIIHLPCHASVNIADIEQLTPIMVAPEAAVPSHWGSRLAIGFDDHCHTTLITPNPNIARQALTGFISAYVESAIGSPMHIEIPQHLQDALMAPMLPGEWTEIRFQSQRRYWTIDFAHQGEVTHATRWVAPARHGSWRSGWSW